MVAKGRNMGCSTSQLFCWPAFSPMTLLNEPVLLMHSALEVGSCEAVSAWSLSTRLALPEFNPLFPSPLISCCWTERTSHSTVTGLTGDIETVTVQHESKHFTGQEYFAGRPFSWELMHAGYPAFIKITIGTWLPGKLHSGEWWFFYPNSRTELSFSFCFPVYLEQGLPSYQKVKEFATGFIQYGRFRE